MARLLGLAADGASCELSSTSIRGAHIEALFFCPPGGQATIELHHPDQCPRCVTHTERFALKTGKPEPPGALIRSLGAVLRQHEGAFNWQRPSRSGTARSPEEAPPPGVIDALLWRWQTIAARSLLPWGALLVLVLVWAPGCRGVLSRKDLLLALGVLAGAAVLRCAVPWVPGNWYADFAAPPPCAPDLYGKGGFFRISLLSAVLSLRPDGRSLFVANVVVGSLAPALLYLACRVLTGATRPALLLAGLVAIVPFFVRLSATDSPHVLILACFCLAGLALATWVRLRRWTGLLVAAACVLLAGPARPDTYMGFWALLLVVVWVSPTLREAWRHHWPAVLIVGLALALAGLPLAMQAIDQHGFGQASNFPAVSPVAKAALVASRALTIVSLLPERSPAPLVPWVVHVLYLTGWLLLVLRRRLRALLLIGLGLLLMSLPQLATNFGGLVENLTIGRYMILTAVLWMVPVVVAVDAALGWVERWKGARLMWAAGLSVAGTVAISSVGAYCHTVFFQQEHVFLQRSLPRTGLLVAVWGPSVSGASDLNCCTALPHLLLARSRPGLRWLVIDPEDPKADAKLEELARATDPVYWYETPLARMSPTAPDPRLRSAFDAYLAKARRLTAAVSALGWTGPIAEFEATSNVEPTLSMLDFPPSVTKVKLRLWRREPAAAPASTPASTRPHRGRGRRLPRLRTRPRDGTNSSQPKAST